MISEDPVEDVITKLKAHPSVKLVNNTFSNTGASFSLKHVLLDETSKEIGKLNPIKASLAINIPNKVIKE